MNPLRIVAVVTILSASFHAAAADSARCAELQANLRKLDSYIAGSPTASDRQRFVEARTAQAKLLPYACGSGGTGSSAGSLPRSPGSAALPSVMSSILGALPPPDAYKVPEPPPGPPAPPTPSGSVDGPISMQRLPGTAPAAQALEQHAASGFPTDAQIAAECATSPNPSSCALVRESQRNQDPAYQRWKADDAALQQRNIDRSLANIDTTIAASQQAIPKSPPPMPYDNSDPDLAKCREGSKDPWTIAGCYDLSRKPVAARAPAAKPGSDLRDRLRRSLSGSDDASDGGPNRDFANEQKQIAEWKQGAQARLAEALRNGATLVPEDKAARAECNGWWLYEGLSPGRCEPGRNRLVYAVDPPVQSQPTAGAAPIEEKPFHMDAAETEREIKRLKDGVK